MEEIINIIAISGLLFITYHSTLYYNRKNLQKCSTLYKLKE
jgi:hypothetical protein